MLDLVPALIGAVGLVAAALDAGGNPAVSILRTLAGAAFLGAVTDAMLLGHWYLVQPGLPRGLLDELVDALGWVWPIEVVALLLPTGMVSVWTGAVDDGWGGTLGWFWAACAVITLEPGLLAWSAPGKDSGKTVQVLGFRGRHDRPGGAAGGRRLDPRPVGGESVRPERDHGGIDSATPPGRPIR